MRPTDAARWLAVTDDDEVRGQSIDRRARALGIFTTREFERMTERVGRRVPRASIKKAIGGVASDAIFDRVEAALDRLEEETEPEMPEDPGPNLIRMRVEGVYGAKSLILEGSPENQAQLEAMVDRIMWNLRHGDVSDT